MNHFGHIIEITGWGIPLILVLVALAFWGRNEPLSREELARQAHRRRFFTALAANFQTQITAAREQLAAFIYFFNLDRIEYHPRPAPSYA